MIVRAHKSDVMRQIKQRLVKRNIQDRVEFKRDLEIGRFKAYAIHLPSEDDAEALRQREDVQYVVKDRVVRLRNVLRSTPIDINLTAYPETKSMAQDPTPQWSQWNLGRIVSRDKPAINRYIYDDLAGEGANVYVVDTGVRTTHLEFEGRAIWGANFVNDSAGFSDPDGHGTHVAGKILKPKIKLGIIGGKRVGIAKKVRIIAVRVLDGNGDGYVSDVFSGIIWATLHGYYSNRPFVIKYLLHTLSSHCSLSLGWDYDADFNDLIRECINAGAHISVAAGNDHRDACLDSPGTAPKAINVGSSDVDDYFSYFTNTGTCVDLFAPGSDIVSCSSASNTQFAMMSGTSMAAPHVSGVIALHLARHNYTPAEMGQLLIQTATSDKLQKDPFATSLLAGTPNRLLYASPPLYCSPGTAVRTSLSDCEPCLSGYYCPGGEFNMTQCPQNSTTSMEGASSIIECAYCAAGYFRQNDTCVLCQQDFYCPGHGIDISFSCPANTTALNGSRSADDCTCTNGLVRNTTTSCGQEVCFECVRAPPQVSQITAVTYVAIAGAAAVVVFGGIYMVAQYFRRLARVKAQNAALQRVAIQA